MRTAAIAPFLLLLAMGTPAPGAEPIQASAAETALHALVDRQDAIFKAAAAAGKDVDLDNVRQRLQALAWDFDTFLKRNPSYGPGFAAYGVMLGKIDMRKESAAALLKANQLLRAEFATESNRTLALLKTWALVKNQLGNFVAEEGRPVEASAYFIDAIDLVPKEPLYHFQLANLLTEARDDFLKSGQWTRAKIDQAAGDAYRTAAELAPERFEYAYGYAQSFYAMEKPDWDAALRVWARLEEAADTPVERETMRLHAANILIRQEKADHARALIATVEHPDLQKRKDELLQLLKGTAK